MNIIRELTSEIIKHSDRKMILITGPRQSGKTTIAKNLGASVEYLNYDRKEDRLKIIKERWDREKEYLVLDEIHKMRKWKLWLKGVFDTRGDQKIIVTGSAKIDAHRKVGDSMAGRYFSYQLYPFDLKELNKSGHGNTKDNFISLMEHSGFPEPFLEGSTSFYKKWRRTHLDVIIRDDLISLESMRRVDDLETLIELMRERVGAPFSYSSLREDLHTDDKSVKRWMIALENSYLLFKVSPYFKSLKDSIKKSPKYYFYDYPRVIDEGARLENFVALALYKEINFRNDVEGESYSLHFLRNKRGHEIDFLICREKRPFLMLEVKKSDQNISKNFDSFLPALKKINPNLKAIQLVLDIKREYSDKNGVMVCNLTNWLEKVPF